MRSRAATKGRKLLFLAAVCLLPALLLSPTAEASRGVPAATLNLEPPIPQLAAEAPPAPQLDLFHLEDELLVEILTGVEPEHHQALLEHRRLELLPTSAIQKTASGVSTSDLRLNVQKGKPLKPDLQWTVPFYAKARFYDPEVGRFLSEDPAAPDLTTPPSLHKYLYAYGNPTRYWDPYGLAPEDPDEELIGNRIVNAIADSPVGEAIKDTTGAVGELAQGAGKLAGQVTEKSLRGNTPEDPHVRELQQELGLDESRPMIGAQPGRTINRRLASEAGEIVERGTSTLVEEAIYLGAGKAVSKTGKILETVSPTNRRIRTGGGYVEVSDDVASGAPLSGGFGRRTKVIVESSVEAKTNHRTLVGSSEVSRSPTVQVKKSYRPGDVLPDGRIAGQGPGAAHISDPGFSLAPGQGSLVRWSRTKTPWQRQAYQRPSTDIDWDFVRPEKARHLPGVTNRVAARRGYAPVRINQNTGKVDELVLHHANQNPRGAVIETWRSTHGSIPHSMEVYWRKWRPDWATAWQNEQSAYWRWRTGRYDPPPTTRLFLPGDPQ